MDCHRQMDDMWFITQCWQTDTTTSDFDFWHASVEDSGVHPHPELMLGNGKNVLLWGSEDCIAWAQQVCRSRGMDAAQVNLGNFGNFTGEMLARLSQYDFYVSIDRRFGDVFYEEFQKLMERGGLVTAADHTSPLAIEPVCDNFSPGTPPNEDYHITDLSNELTDLSKEFTDLSYELTDLSKELPEDIQNVVDFVLSNSDGSFATPDASSDQSIVKEESVELDLSMESDLGTEGSLFDVPSRTSSPVTPIDPTQCPLTPVESCIDVLEKIKTKSRKRERGPKNWEYLMRLLADRSYNPKVIRWEDEKAMTFRIVKPDKVAKIWGQRSNKPHLTYDNFARGLRYHYTTGALKAVSERQLVYKCGIKAKRYLQEVLNIVI